MSVVGSARGRSPMMSALLATSAVATVMMAGAASAQTAKQPSDETALSEVVVTGSRIRSEGFTAPTPTQALGQAELERAVRHGARIIGVNNRDLAVFKTDLALSERLIPQFPPDVIAVSESGIFGPAESARARAAGAHAVLVGEALMKAAEPAALLEAIATA